MTACGILAGANSLTPEKLVVAGSLLVLAVSDSPSEAYAMYNSKISEGSSPWNALKYALYAMSGNLVVPVVFIIPVFIMPLQAAVYLDLIMAGCVLLILKCVHSLASQESIIKNAFQTLLLAAAIVVAATLAGNFISYVFAHIKPG
jgi:VIT1/CCC1 family predicted Fe2+/Mn2+ transporter